jgi:hypothetical protein
MSKAFDLAQSINLAEKYFNISDNGNIEANKIYFVDTTVAIAQVNTIHDITVANNTTYTTTIDGTDYTYTSDSSANISEIINGVKDSINGDSNCNVSAVADSSNNTVILTAKVAGNPFNVSVDSNMNIDITTPNKSKPVTLFLPSSPKPFDSITIWDIKGSFNDNNCTIDGNGKNVMGATTCILDINNKEYHIIYDSNSDEWRVS